MSRFLIILTWCVAVHADTIGTALDEDRTGVAIIWCGVLFTVAFFRELAHDCSAYDEEHTIARARAVH